MQWRRSAPSSVVLALALMGWAGHATADDDRVVRNFSQGTGTAAVGIVAAPDGAADDEIEGPQAIYSGKNGEVYLLDQVNGRVLQFDPNQPERPPQTLELPENMRPTDLVVADDNIYVWDGQVRSLQPTGEADAPTRGLTLTRSAAPPDEATLSTFAQMGSAALPGDDDPDEVTRGVSNRPPQRSRQQIASHGRGAVTANLTPVQETGVEIALQAKDGPAIPKLKLQVRSKLGAVEVLDIDKRGRIFVLGENVPTDVTDLPSAFVARYSDKGALEGVYELPLDHTVALSRRFVTVSPEGEVYFLRTRKGVVDVLGVGFRQIKSGQIVDAVGRAPQPQVGDPGTQLSLNNFVRPRGTNAAVRTLTRAQVIKTAFDFANVRWRVNPGAYGPDPDRACSGFNRIRRPGYLQGKLNQEVVGIPYCWGCHGSLPQIAAAIERGTPAGNVCTRNDPRPGVAGVDCSAFVSATWGLATHFTTIAIPAIAAQLSNPWDLLPGDALDKPGSHVMLFLRFTPDKRAEVMESSTGGCNGKVCRNVYPLASLLARGYRPMRYRGLANDTSVPAAEIARTGTTPTGRTR